MQIQTQTLINVNLASNILYSSLFYRKAHRISLQFFPRCQSSPCFQYNFLATFRSKNFPPLPLQNSVFSCKSTNFEAQRKLRVTYILLVAEQALLMSSFFSYRFRIHHSAAAFLLSAAGPLRQLQTVSCACLSYTGKRMNL